MINRFVSDDCYGCGACILECSDNAVMMKKNEEGFWYPSVDSDKCIDCRKCLAVCPVLNTDYQRKNPLAGYAFIGNDDLRARSSSGGAFGAIAEKVLNEGGYVCGAAFADDYKSVRHILINDIKDLHRIQKSKYIQSRTVSIYQDIKGLLEKKKKVFFCGTPCQTAGLYSYLRKGYGNLITADLFCHAAPSEYAWEKFMAEKGKVSEADFRDKTRFYPYAMRLRINGKDIYEPQTDCDFMQGFYIDLFCRDCCGHCPFPYFDRIGDVTLADFWGVEEVMPQMDHTGGCSAVLINTEKGKNIAETYLKDSSVTMIEVSPRDITIRNGAAERHFTTHPGKKVFFRKLQEGVSFSESYQKARRVPYDFGLVGFWYTWNYGAALTAYALERTVQKMGYSVLMIDAPGTMFGCGDAVYDHSSPVRRFISQFCIVSERQESQYDLQKLNDLCDGFLLGSDQLWGWQEGRYHEQGAYYLLDFANAEKRKVAYGTSFGKTEFAGDVEDRNAFGFLLGRFSEISVRERDAVTICKECFNRDAEWVVDPVFLLAAEEYIRVENRSILDETVRDEDYILVYLLQPTKKKNEVIRQAAEKMSKRVIAVSDLDPDYAKYYPCDAWDFGHYTELEVADWIKLICHAACVITDSYHGFCFSIIFRKEFFALTPRGALNRFQTIAEITGLEDRIDICGRNTVEFENLPPIDYCAVWEKLQKEVDRSREWLENALKKEAKPAPYDRLYDMLRYDHLRQEADWLRQKADYEQQLSREREQYFALSSMLRRKSFIERKYIVRSYLMQKLTGRHIAIRGAGIHTTELLKLLGSTDLSILCIWDREISGQFPGGYPIIKDVRELKKYGVDTILLSSWKYRGEMAADARKQLRENQMEDIEILDFYEQLQKEGIPMDSEFYWYEWQLPT